MFYGYARVSSTDQNLDRQIEQFKTFNLDRLFTDKASGKNLERVGFESLKNALQTGDTVIVVSMDRLSRSLKDLLDTVNFFGEKGVTIKFLKENIELQPGNVSPVSKLLLGIMGAVAEFERNLIRERQREGIEIAKKKGIYKGRKPVDEEAIRLAVGLVKVGWSVSRACKEVGIGRTTFYSKRQLIDQQTA